MNMKKKIQNVNLAFNQKNDYFQNEDSSSLIYLQNQITEAMEGERLQEIKKNYGEDESNNQEEELNLNQQYIMKKALLKNINMDIIKKIEIDYFMESYGNFFN